MNSSSDASEFAPLSFSSIVNGLETLSVSYAPEHGIIVYYIIRLESINLFFQNLLMKFCWGRTRATDIWLMLSCERKNYLLHTIS